jgi:hypothetical protein
MQIPLRLSPYNPQIKHGTSIMGHTHLEPILLDSKLICTAQCPCQTVDQFGSAVQSTTNRLHWACSVTKFCSVLTKSKQSASEGNWCSAGPWQHKTLAQQTYVTAFKFRPVVKWKLRRLGRAVMWYAHYVPAYRCILCQHFHCTLEFLACFTTQNWV